MASTRVPTLRNLLNCPSRSFRASQQRRWAQVHDIRFLVTTQPRRNILEKYRDKLDRRAREEGHEDIDALKRAYAEKIEQVRKRDVVAPSPSDRASPSGAQAVTPKPPGALQPTENAASAAAAAAAAKSAAEATSSTSRPPTTPAPAIKPLSSFLDLDKVRALPTTELSTIWRLRHASAPSSLCAVLPAATYAAMESAGRAHPQFVLPVPHAGQGAELHFLQWTFDAPSRTSTVLFARLAEYKARGEFAVPHTTVTHHADLAAEKGVVLMRGGVTDGSGVKVEEAQWLVMCLQRFYGGWHGQGEGQGDGEGAKVGKERAAERRRLLEWFASGDERFSVEKLMEEAERLG